MLSSGRFGFWSVGSLGRSRRPRRQQPETARLPRTHGDGTADEDAPGNGHRRDAEGRRGAVPFLNAQSGPAASVWIPVPGRDTSHQRDMESIRNFHMVRLLRTECSEQWVLVPCRYSWGLHLGTPFAVLDLHFPPDGGLRGTLALDRSILKRGEQRFPTAEEQRWLSLIRGNFLKDDEALCEIRILEVTDGALCWTEVEEGRIESYADPDWMSLGTTAGRCDTEFEYHLVSRTETSEVHAIWPCERHPMDDVNARSTDREVGDAIEASGRHRIGELHLHFERSGGLGSILLVRDLSRSQTEDLIESIGYHLLRGSGHIFTLWVQRGSEKATYEWVNEVCDIT